MAEEHHKNQNTTIIAIIAIVAIVAIIVLVTNGRSAQNEKVGQAMSSGLPDIRDSRTVGLPGYGDGGDLGGLAGSGGCKESGSTCIKDGDTCKGTCKWSADTGDCHCA